MDNNSITNGKQEEKFETNIKYWLDIGTNGMNLRWFRFLNSLRPTPCDFYSEFTRSDERGTLWWEIGGIPSEIIQLLSDYPSRLSGTLQHFTKISVFSLRAHWAH